LRLLLHHAKVVEEGPGSASELGGLKLVLMSGVFAVLDFHDLRVDLSLIWCKLIWLAHSGPGCIGWG